MLHTSTRKTFDLAEVYALLLETLQDQVDSFEPHCCGSEDFAFARVCEDALGNAIFGAEVAIEVYLRLMLVLQVRVDNDAYSLSVTNKTRFVRHI